MLSPEQLEMRRTMVTATDTVALAGESPSRGPLEVYVDKTTVVPPWGGNEATRIGNELEPLALKFLSEYLVRPITPGTTERDAVVPHFGASLDGNILDVIGGTRVGLAEAKVVGFRMAREWAGNQPPDKVLVQVTKQMMVTKLRLAWVVALIGTEPKFYEVEYNDVLAEALAEQDTAFWVEHVVPRIPPSPGGSESDTRALRQLYPRVKGDVFRASPEVEEIAKAYFAAKREAEHAKDRLEDLANKMKATIAEAAGIEGDGWIAKWSDRKGSISWKDAFDALGPKVPAATLERFRGDSTRTFKAEPVK